jgi:type I restriction enzyme, S subunit
MADLKPGWRRVKFGEVVRLNKETCKDPVAAGIDRVIGLEHLEPGDLRVRSWGDVAEGTTFTNRVRPGQVLFGKRRAYQRKVAVAEFDAICSGDIYVFESANSSRLLPELLPFICQTDAFFEHAVGTSAGSLSPRTNWSSLAEYGFVLPPVEEQRRVTVALRALRAAAEHAGDAADQAAVAFRATRHDAFQRMLTARLPQRSIDELANHRGVVDGPFGSNLKSEHWTTSGVPVIQSQHITSGHFRMTEPYFVSADTFRGLQRSDTQGGDIVMVKKGINCGACALLDDGHARSLLSSNCMRIRVLDAHATAPYVAQFLHWYREHGRFEGLIGSTQQRATTLREVRRIPVPLPSLEAQSVLVDQLAAIEAAGSALRLRRDSAGAMLREVAHALAGAPP